MYGLGQFGRIFVQFLHEKDVIRFVNLGLMAISGSFESEKLIWELFDAVYPHYLFRKKIRKRRSIIRGVF